MWNSGQTCMANSRIYVHENVKEKFLEGFRKKCEERRMGDPLDGKINHGPQADKTQFETVLKFIDIGKKEGGKLLLGGEAGKKADGTPDSFIGEKFPCNSGDEADVRKYRL